MPTYFLRDVDYERLVTADSRTPLIELFPNGLVFEMRGDEITSIRQPVAGDDPELMRQLEDGLKAMNQALMDSGRYE